jgi:hypothetical protein
MVAVHQAEQIMLIRRQPDVSAGRRIFDDEIFLAARGSQPAGDDAFLQLRSLEDRIDAVGKRIPDRLDRGGFGQSEGRYRAPGAW